jgi:hypothetical protein
VNVCPAIVTVPVRDAVLGFAATSYDTVPFPFPLAPPVRVIQAALLVAVHVQPAPAVTVTVPLVATEVLRFADEGRMVNEQGAPGCVMVNVFPATVRVPVRDAVLVFCVTLYVTLPLPVPLAPAPIVIHVLLLVDVQAQPAPVVTVIDPLAASDDGRLFDVGEMVIVHGAPACVIVNVFPAIVTVPVRDAVPVLAVTL